MFVCALKSDDEGTDNSFLNRIKLKVKHHEYSRTEENGAHAHPGDPA